MQSSLRQKEVIIIALGAQLDDAAKTVQLRDKEFEQAAEMKEALMKEKDDLERIIESAKIENEALQSSLHAQKIEENKRRMQAVEKAKQDIRSAAEAQFANANAVYLRLQSEHDSKCEEISKLTKQLKEAHAQVESCMKESNACCRAGIAWILCIFSPRLFK